MKTYTLTVPAYGKEAGEQVKLDPGDSGVILNVAAGVLTEGKAAADAQPAAMTCPICADTMKRPPKLANQDELSEHYSDKHAGFAVPPWAADEDLSIRKEGV